MAQEFKVPELGENIAAGEVVRVAVSEGETVRRHQTVVELETDKAVVEVPSTVEGTITAIAVQVGQNVHVGEVLFRYEAAEAEKVEDVSTNVDVSPAASSHANEPLAPSTEAASLPDTSASSSLQELRLPELGENIVAGEVVRVAVAVGARIVVGQTVLELETDKAVVEVPSTVAGRVREVAVSVGQNLAVGALILTVEASDESAASGKETRSTNVDTVLSSRAKSDFVAPAASPATVASPLDEPYMEMTRHSFRSARAAEGKSEEQAFPPDAPAAALAVGARVAGQHRNVPAAPIVRKLAREIGVDIYLVKGSGPGGRIGEADVKAFAKATFARLSDPSASVQTMPSAGAPLAIKLPDFARWGKIEKLPLRGIRRKTAEHLALAWNQIPHVTQHDKADVTDLEQLRQRFAPKAEAAGGKLTMTAIALKVVASALKTFPQFNASIDVANEEIVYKKNFHIGVAVDTERGLLVPVLRDVDRKNILELAVELAEISRKARERKLSAEEMEGGTFTITNLGGIGGTAFTPIINHPEVAILGLSRARLEPVWRNGQFEPRSLLPLSLSYDHRLIDGADAARFVHWIVEALEQPFLLAVQG